MLNRIFSSEINCTFNTFASQILCYLFRPICNSTSLISFFISFEFIRLVEHKFK